MLYNSGFRWDICYTYGALKEKSLKRRFIPQGVIVVIEEEITFSSELRTGREELLSPQSNG